MSHKFTKTTLTIFMGVSVFGLILGSCEQNGDIQSIKNRKQLYLLNHVCFTVYPKTGIITLAEDLGLLAPPNIKPFAFQETRIINEYFEFVEGSCEWVKGWALPTMGGKRRLLEINILLRAREDFPTLGKLRITKAPETVKVKKIEAPNPLNAGDYVSIVLTARINDEKPLILCFSLGGDVTIRTPITGAPIVKLPFGYDQASVQITPAAVPLPNQLIDFFEPIGDGYNIQLSSGPIDFGSNFARIIYSYDSGTLHDTGYKEDFSVFCFDTIAAQWERVEKVETDYTNHTITAYAKHLSVFVLAAVPVGEDIVYVRAQDGDDSNPGTAEAPKRTIQAGIDTADNLFTRGRVLVAQGTYYVASPILIKEDISVYGSYGASDWGLRDTVTFASSIINTNDSVGGTTDAKCAMLFGSDITGTTIVDGFILQGGGGDMSAGILVRGGSPEIRNNVVWGGAGNESVYGINLRDHSAARIYGNEIHGSQGPSQWSTGIQCNGSTPEIVKNRVESLNGIYSIGISVVNDGNPVIIDNSIRSSCPMGGYETNSWVIWIQDATATIMRNDISAGYGGSSCGIFGSDIGHPSSGAARIFNNKIDGGTGDTIGGCGISLGSYSSAYIRNNTINGGASPRATGIILSMGYISGDSMFDDMVAIENNIIFTESEEMGIGIEKHFATSHPISLRNNAIFHCPTALLYDTHSGSYSTTLASMEEDLVEQGIFYGATDILCGGNVSLDPAFADAEGGDWTFTDSSPCAITRGGLDGGAEGFGFSDDMNGAGRTVPWSMGAYEGDGACSEDTTQNIVYVHINGNDANPGTASLPKKTIQGGLDRAAALFTEGRVHVAAGQYDLRADQGDYITLRNSISLYGGYSPEDWNQRDTATYLTIIQDHSLPTVSSENRAVVAPESISTTTILDGFTIRGGGTNCACLYILTSSLVVENNSIRGGSGPNYSRGICVKSSSPHIRNNSIVGGTGWSSCGIENIGASMPVIEFNIIDGGNTATESFGILNDGASPAIVNNLITGGSGENCFNTTGIYEKNNAASTISGNAISGGNGSLSYGIRLEDSISRIQNNTIEGGQGGISYGIHMESSSPYIRNNSINGGNNTSPYGIYLKAFSSPVIENNIIFTMNTQGTFSVGVSEAAINADPTSFRNNDIFNCSRALYVDWDGGGNLTTIGAVIADLAGESIPSTGNISANPQFVDILGGNWKLGVTSPCAVCTGGLDGATEGFGFTKDKGDTLRTAPWSMGAYEWDEGCIP